MIRLERVKEILGKRLYVPLDDETYEEMDDTYNTAIDCINFRIAKKVVPKKCAVCEKRNIECMTCTEYTPRCPICNSSLENENEAKYKFCPECGQKLIWA